MKARLPRWLVTRGRATGLLVGFLYGVLMRLLFGASSDLSAALGVMSAAFIFLVPFALGAVTLHVATRGGEAPRPSWGFVLFGPWEPTLLAVLASAVFGWEGFICVVMALPVVLVMASIGGLSIALTLRRAPGRTRDVSVSLVALAPFLVSPIEGLRPAPDTTRTVDTAIEIAATPETVWAHIARVARIEEGEHAPSLFQRIGFPRPIEATLSEERVGGVRHASFEGRLVFVETVTVWEPPRTLAFSIEVDPATIPPTTLDAHVTLGGPYFDVLDGTYTIEPLGPARVRLHLQSRQRLSTRFNFYAGFWSDLVMRDIQEHILGVLARRCERARI